MKLSEWARRQGIGYHTAWAWYKKGILPVPAVQLPTGTILVDEPQGMLPESAAIYARVSSADQRDDLDGQVARVLSHLSTKQVPVTKSVTEIGSGLNGHRPKLLRLLSDKTVTIIAVEHRDRLMRFGAEYVEAALRASGRRLLVVEPTEVTDDLVSDMIEVLTSFCARLYGRRSARSRAKKALACAASETGSPGHRTEAG
ncbi:MAG: IS607 family transposase [Actinobacteria bacterium]|jgi:putative resolvase|nr:IS607 family transposase [Actinomycetota bacterium]MDA8301903.1 IS607 family transposase [Actinomycetota bacterium]